jgi:hypothetical protein
VILVQWETGKETNHYSKGKHETEAKTEVAFNMHKLIICAPCTSLDQRIDFALLIKFSILLRIRLHVLSLFLFPTRGALETSKFKATVTWNSGMKLWSNRKLIHRQINHSKEPNQQNIKYPCIEQRIIILMIFSRKNKRDNNHCWCKHLKML